MEETKTIVADNIETQIVTYRDSIIENFEKHNILPEWHNYNAVSKFKSVRRAIRRGHVDLFTGIVYPSRPYNNRKSSKGRKMNDTKKQIYGQLKARAKAH